MCDKFVDYLDSIELYIQMTDGDFKVYKEETDNSILYHFAITKRDPFLTLLKQKKEQLFTLRAVLDIYGLQLKLSQYMHDVGELGYYISGNAHVFQKTFFNYESFYQFTQNFVWPPMLHGEEVEKNNQKLTIFC